MTITLLISEQTVKDLLPISENIKINTALRQKIWDAQVQYIKPLICKDLYDELITQKQTNTLTPNNLLLLDQIQPALAYYSLFLFLPQSWARVREQGVVNQNGDTAQTISLSDLNFLRNDAKASADNFALILENYLYENKNIYPLYNCKCGCATEGTGKIDDIFFTV